ncbi:uncharacterized protein L969DRAFT_95365 [Mixia osmundae IAM 14324]|uniref:50S ribosomal protein L35 n=1 Tax=Mixia osmundae (strain CBS 9802 / IAM 14324 / JCM 22182 / KY 12970) TaxID=764103 RepID=G7DZ59_MIXOS|nr:uncharacterized protein L969DRAFT_95365 [Mixia osmundae IAM 14324]KEI38270.1 hypothetical protein L969DRAFT_95365 [Mixia osmundae IAM 14324]GAA95869.1 hypothetical protein E5Q_02526 [Mixia osmundae IAM 14324]
MKSPSLSATAQSISSEMSALFGHRSAIQVILPSRGFASTSLALAGYKIKTHKGTAKRWTALASGLFKRGKVGKRHLNVTLTPERRQRLGGIAYANAWETRHLRKLLPYYKSA